MKQKILSTLLVGFGLFVVFGTHIWMFFSGLPMEYVIGHAIINIIAGVLIVLHLLMQRM